MLLQEINDLPLGAGVYFFYDNRDELIYIGKSICIRKRVLQHFSGKDRKSLNIQMRVKRIDYEVTGSELIALLYESDLIKRHQPCFNRALKRVIYTYGLYLCDVQGYLGLKLDRVRPNEDEVVLFSSLREARESLFRITETYGLCQKINGLYKTTATCFQYHLKQCKGACCNKETTTDYNERVMSFVRSRTIDLFTRLFEVEGRNDGEIGLVYIENGIYRGFGFCPKGTRKTRKLSFIDNRADNKDVRRILIRHLINER